jgi:hypothetical protein
MRFDDGRAGMRVDGGARLWPMETDLKLSDALLSGRGRYAKFAIMQRATLRGSLTADEWRSARTETLS